MLTKDQVSSRDTAQEDTVRSRGTAGSVGHWALTGWAPVPRRGVTSFDAVHLGYLPIEWLSMD